MIYTWIVVLFYVCFARLLQFISSIIMLSPFHSLLYRSFVTPQSGNSPEASTLLPTASCMLRHSCQRTIVQREFANEMETLELSPEFGKTRAAVKHCSLARRHQ